MLKPSMNELMARVDNRYLLVNLAAQRARDISEEAERDAIKLPDKPVKIALDEIAAGHIVYRPGPRPAPEPEPEVEAAPEAAGTGTVEAAAEDASAFALEPDIIYSGRSDFSDSQEF